MSVFSCPECGWPFKAPTEQKKHNKRCVRKAYLAGPSYKSDIPKGLLKARRTIEGTYEWALLQSNKATSNKLKIAFTSTPKEKLAKEIERLESILAFNENCSDKELKRLIAISHAFSSIQNQVSQSDKKNLRKAAVRDLNSKLKPDKNMSNDIMDVYFKSGVRAVRSGGLPSLGKKK